jgi:hypothetical protein
MINEEEISDKMNPILEIQQRNQEEVDIVLQMIKGLFFLILFVNIMRYLVYTR